MESNSPFIQIHENHNARINNLNNKLEIASKDKIFNITDFTKTILLMSSTILAVLISLYNKTSFNIFETCSFVSTIVLFTLNILFGTIALYVGVASSIGTETLLINELVDFEKGAKLVTRGTIPETKENNPKIIYAVSWATFKIISVLSLLSLVTYAIIKVL